MVWWGCKYIETAHDSLQSGHSCVTDGIWLLLWSGCCFQGPVSEKREEPGMCELSDSIAIHSVWIACLLYAMVVIQHMFNESDSL